MLLAARRTAITDTGSIRVGRVTERREPRRGGLRDRPSSGPAGGSPSDPHPFLGTLVVCATNDPTPRRDPREDWNGPEEFGHTWFEHAEEVRDYVEKHKLLPPHTTVSRG